MDMQETETIEGTEPCLVDEQEADRRIAERTRMEEMENLLTSEQLASRAGLETRQAVHDWLENGRIVGWQGAERDYVFPTGQFDEHGQPLKGLDRITRLFGDAFAAWCWLIVPNDALDGAEPLALLRKGKVDYVEAAAKGYLQGDFA